MSKESSKHSGQISFAAAQQVDQDALFVSALLLQAEALAVELIVRSPASRA